MLIHGKCHCGNLSFSLVWEPSPTEIPARACGCSFCTRHGGVWTANPHAALRVVVREPSRVSRYTFETQTAEFHICTRCGVVPVVTSRIDEQLYAVVNVNTFEGIDPSMLRPAPVSFEGEDTESRLARRKRNWIGKVEYIEADPATGDTSSIGMKVLAQRTLTVEDARLASVTLHCAVDNPDDDNIDASVLLKDGRSFGFTIFSIRNLQRLTEGSLSFVSPGMLVVSRLTDEAILHAVRSAAELGIEQFGVLQH
jgi:hypothetical protein